ncbi:MAG: hypothetical protein ACLSIF_07880 [Faecalimonas umbilicata]
MFCTECGRKLKKIYSSGELVGYCSKCGFEVEICSTELDNKMNNNFLQDTIGKIIKNGCIYFDFLLDQMVETQVKERIEEERKVKHRQECEKDASIQLTFIFGHQLLGIKNQVYLRQKKGGDLYFDYNENVLFRLVSYEWEGAEYVTVSNSEEIIGTERNGYSRQKGKAMAVGAGAIAGGMIASGLGAAVGAAIGASGPKKVKTKEFISEKANTSYTVEDQEKDTHAQLVIKSKETDENYRLMIVCNRTIDGMIRCLDWSE